jgi:1-acyl-sn-glycerol-3-phosphate acyltransferase
MLIAPLFIPFTLNRQFPLLVARTVFAPGLLWIAGAKLTVKGRENVPLNKPVIFVANHCSHLDIGVLCKSLPVNLHFIGKKELIWAPVVGWYMWVAGHIFIDRNNKKKAIKSLEAAAQKIKSGKSVVMYPEGTRSKDGKLSVFKKGAFHLATQAGVAIVPVSIKGTHNIWPATSNKITPGKVFVEIGAPIESTNYNRQTIQQFITDTREVILKMQA